MNNIAAFDEFCNLLFVAIGKSESVCCDNPVKKRNGDFLASEDFEILSVVIIRTVGNEGDDSHLISKLLQKTCGSHRRNRRTVVFISEEINY